MESFHSSQSVVDVASLSWLRGIPNTPVDDESLSRAIIHFIPLEELRNRPSNSLQLLSFIPESVFGPLSRANESLHSISLLFQHNSVVITQHTIATEVSMNSNDWDAKGKLTVDAFHCGLNRCVGSTLQFDSKEMTSITNQTLLRHSFVTAKRRTLVGKGHHLELETEISLRLVDVPRGSLCSASLIERLPESFFVDQYQVQERRKFGDNTTVLLDHVMDLEKPAYQSTANVFMAVQTAFVQDQTDFDLYFQVPVHLRYQKPKNGIPFAVASIPPPTISIVCSSEVSVLSHHSELYTPIDLC
jgi:hypothetical protein